MIADLVRGGESTDSIIESLSFPLRRAHPEHQDYNIPSWSRRQEHLR
jgi:hypothetical protein